MNAISKCDVQNFSDVETKNPTGGFVKGVGKEEK